MITGNEPIHGDKDYTCVGAGGLTIRQYFAIKALQGLVSFSGKDNLPAFKGEAECYPYYATIAVKYADALIAELNK